MALLAGRIQLVGMATRRSFATAWAASYLKTHAKLYSLLTGMRAETTFASKAQCEYRSLPCDGGW